MVYLLLRLSFPNKYLSIILTVYVYCTAPNFCGLKIFMILANFDDYSLFCDFKMSSPVLKGTVGNFHGKFFCDFCLIYQNHEII